MTPRGAAVVVVGLGAMGAATLYQLARRGVQAIGIDRFTPPHAMGSSHGETRITRCAIGEGDAYVPLVLRSHEIWRMLEAETGTTLLETCGLLMLGRPGANPVHHGGRDFLARTAAIATRHGIPHERLDAATIAARHPAFLLTGDEEGYFEPVGGFVHPERCIAAACARAAALGATILTDRRVEQIDADADGVRIICGDGVITADRVVVAAGAWTGRLLGGGFADLLRPYRQVLHWFPTDSPGLYAPGAFPAFIWLHGGAGEGYFYGFPALPGTGTVKLATEHYAAPYDPDTDPRTVTRKEEASMHADHVARRLARLGAAPTKSAVCSYTVTPDAGFVIDQVPGRNRITVISACSGHGFKHSAAIGEAVAQRLCDGCSAIDMTPFRLSRPGLARPA